MNIQEDGMAEKVREYLRWLLKPPHPRDLWTYCGVWILDGVATGLLYRMVFTHLAAPTIAGILAGTCASLLVGFMLYRMGFKLLHAFLITAGGMCIAVANWPTINIGLSELTTIALTVFGMTISLPLFCRGMEVIRPKTG